MTDRLFEVTPVEEPEQLSYGQRLTLRNRQALLAGIHPATKRPLLDQTDTPEDERVKCGDCAHMCSFHRRAVYRKCAKHVLGMSHSSASDIRVGWPACTLFESATPS